jgi:hypothetical protein
MVTRSASYSGAGSANIRGVADEPESEEFKAQVQEIEDVPDHSLVPDEHAGQDVGDGGHLGVQCSALEGVDRWYCLWSGAA